MSQERKRKPGLKAPPDTAPVVDRSQEGIGQHVTETTVPQFAKEVTEWLVEWADEDDVRRFVAEFKGVPPEMVIVAGDDIKIIAQP